MTETPTLERGAMIRDLWRTTGDAIVAGCLLALLGVATLVLHSWPGAWGILAAMGLVVTVVATRWLTA